MLTFFSATMRLSGSTSITRSTRRNGCRCGRIRMISAMRSSMKQIRNSQFEIRNLFLCRLGWFRSRLAGFGIYAADDFGSDVRDILDVDDTIGLAGDIENDCVAGFLRVSV